MFMGGYTFSRKQCIRALKALGFVLATKRDGKHDKFIPPEYIKKTIQPGQPPFIMVPRHEFHCQNLIVKEIRAMGGDALVAEFVQYL
ncbi:MAG: hypothetical protein HY461_00525 [Parcubacteria group bacterium]|nr:hypothetical protein [Parcubacteria group bacterium]